MSWLYYARSFTVGLLFNEGMTDPKTETSINCAAVHFHTNKFTLCFFTTVGKLKIDTVVHCVAELGVVRLKSGFLWGLHQLQHVTKALILFWPHSQSTALTSSVFCVLCFSTQIETNWRRMSQMFHLNAAKKRFVKGCIPELRKLEKTMIGWLRWLQITAVDRHQVI